MFSYLKTLKCYGFNGSMNSRKVVLLLSGGFDSGLAGYLLQKVGYEIIPLHLSNVDFAGEESIEKSIELAKKFGWKKFYVVDIADALQSLVDNCKHSYYFVLMKRFMLQVAGEIAKKEDAQYIGTGESLGQVSSQTLANISVIEQAASFRVLKPLITFDKEKIINMTIEIKTFEISAGPEVCDLLGPKHPIVNANLENTLNEEMNLQDLDIVSNSLRSLRVIDL
ncbi:MAG: putative tRNA sulfurtransferase [Candidatus Heimdallarchaeota archaeon AB_125]|nr:MAG: putative tRNA sulfurtransferase [Candidatus Heimdallarchaeota archaeon AB_125]